jgi:hypothetical protein
MNEAIIAFAPAATAPFLAETGDSSAFLTRPDAILSVPEKRKPWPRIAQVNGCGAPSLPGKYPEAGAP